MGQKYTEIPEKMIEFIRQQHIFFVGSALENGRINISPKGMDSLRVMGENRVLWLNVTGSGNETAAHIQKFPRMTLMFCAFEGRPVILRLYGVARVIHINDPEWPSLSEHLPDLPGARQIFDMTIDLVQTSCGTAVPLYTYKEDRKSLFNWAEKKDKAGLEKFWADKNQFTIDDVPTNILEKNT